VVEGRGEGRILIDTPPELRLQLTGARVDSVDAVLYTHDHADHIMGIDDLRAMSVRFGRLPVYGPADTLDRLAQRFDYIFDDASPATPGTPRPELTTIPLQPLRQVVIVGMPVTPIPFQHGMMTVFGYRIGPVGYVTDVKCVPPESIERLKGVKVLVLNALLDRPHPTHLSIPEAVEVARAVGAERTIFTHLTHRLSHADLAARLPAGMEPAYDGLTITF
jgi:phosphoribosyl 1,2-cyclic phosphate phosphodiesterase